MVRNIVPGAPNCNELGSHLRSVQPKDTTLIRKMLLLKEFLARVIGVRGRLPKR